MPSTPKGYWQDQVKTQLSEDITEPTPDQPFIHIAQQSNQPLLKIKDRRKTIMRLHQCQGPNKKSAFDRTIFISYMVTTQVHLFKTPVPLIPK